MNNIRKYTAWLGAGAIIMTIAAGCAGPNNETAVGNVAEAGAESTANVATSAMESTGNMATSAVDATGNMASGAANAVDGAGTAVANGAMNAGEAVAGAGDAAIYTPKIKTALGGVAALQGSKIDVDTLADKKEIVLRGTVTSAAQKTLAEATAKKNAPADYTVVNQLTMAGAM